MPRKIFTNGDVLPASDVNTYLMNQAVMTFATSTARASALTAPVQGMVTYLEDDDAFEYWNGTSYEPFGAGSGIAVNYLVIGGGASGGAGLSDDSNAAGGGGAGGYRCSVSGENTGGGSTAEPPMTVITPATLQVTIGAGAPAAGSTSPSSYGNNGSSTIFGVITAVGGGAGGRAGGGSTRGQTGGSGGGSNPAGAPGAGTLNQGFAGGSSGAFSSGTGGGGASQAGGNTSSSAGGNGGNGVSSSITGSGVTRAGGGGGGGYSGSAGGSGGTGGGGNGGASSNGTAGTANTGGGGGGGAGNAAGIASGAGGSGVIILSIPTATSVSFSAGVTQTNAVVGANTVYTITATSTTSETVTIG